QVLTIAANQSPVSFDVFFNRHGFCQQQWTGFFHHRLPKSRNVQYFGMDLFNVDGGITYGCANSDEMINALKCHLKTLTLRIGDWPRPAIEQHFYESPDCCD